MDSLDSIDKTTMNTNHDTNTALTRRSENVQDTAIVTLQTKNVESIGTGVSERETTMTFPRGRKGTTVEVAYHDEKERETLIVSAIAIVTETIIGNQIHLVTDNTGREMIVIIILSMLFSVSFFME